MPGSARERLVLPLDVPDLGTAERLIDQLAEHVGVFKVGLQLFTAAGPRAVEAVHAAGAACFLDLKLHDIPATMAHATRSGSELGVRYLTVHAAAGPRCMAAVAEAATDGPTQLLAVTVLTSMDAAELSSVGMTGSPEEAVMRLARIASDQGIAGLVCSPRECGTLRHALPSTLLVVPGVRPSGSDKGDQRRTATPAEAISAGADLLVVGRPIRNAPDPVAAASQIVAAIHTASGRP